MKMLGGYKQEKTKTRERRVSDAEKASGPVRSRSVSYSNNYRIGRTLAGDAKKTLEAKRARANDQRKRKIKTAVVVSVACIAALSVLFFAIRMTLKQKAERELAIMEAQSFVKEPTVVIVDENAGNNVSQRVKDFVYDLEGDLAPYGLAIDHVSLPLQKARELRIFIINRGEYYKMSLDRGSAVQAEDLSRMVKYLDDNGIAPEYVDLRVSGKAYYK